MAEEKSGFSTALPWLALGVGVVGMGAAAWSERRGSGSAAVDLAKRYRDLQRVASASSGATANERAMAQRLLAKMTPPEPQRQAPRTPSSGGYRYGPGPVPPWQTDERSFFNDIHAEDGYRGLNYTKKAIYDHAKAPRVRVSLQGFDGSYGRASFEAFSALDDLGYAAKALDLWSGAVRPFDAVIGMVEGEPFVRVLRIKDKNVAPVSRTHTGLTIEHDSFNRNPFNDPSFAGRLNDLLAEHES